MLVSSTVVPTKPNMCALHGQAKKILKKQIKSIHQKWLVCTEIGMYGFKHAVVCQTL